MAFASPTGAEGLAKRKIALLVKEIHVTPVDHDTIIASLKDRRVNDFEDGLEYYAAIRSGCEIIVTEDVSDFYFSAIPVVGASNFLTRYFK